MGAFRLWEDNGNIIAVMLAAATIPHLESGSSPTRAELTRATPIEGY